MPLTRRSLFDQRVLLRWVLAGRAVLSAATIAVAATRSDGTGPWLATLAATAMIITAELLWWLRRSASARVQSASMVRLGVQAAIDVLLVTALVHVMPQATVAAAYVLVIAAYALLLPLQGGLTVTLAATALYLFDSLLLQRGVRETAFWAQAVIFNVVFAAVALLASRLREATSEQATLAEELDRVRLEASDILGNIHSGIVTVDGSGSLVFMNPTAERLLQLESAEFSGRDVLDVLKRRSPELWSAMMHGIRGGPKVGRGEGRVTHPDGRMFPIGLSTTTFRAGTNTTPSVTAIFTDISDSKLLGELHLRAERLGAVAELSASLAHEIRNPLASIRSSVEQLARSASAGEDDQILARLIVRESERLSRLLGEFLDFSRVRKTESEPFDLAELVRTVISLVRLHPDVRDGTSIEHDGASVTLEGDEDLLHRVIQNLVLNAAQASDGQGHIIVRTGLVGADELPQGAGIESAALLQVQDDGPGIPEEIRERLFEPFVSRREGGSGLGLAIVQRAVEAHRGLVFVESAPGEGTTFTIYLPVRWTAEQTA